MIFLGYNFLRDSYCWQPTPTNLVDITNINIKNGIYDHFNVTKDVSSNYSPLLPGVWNLSTIMDADFKGNINAGNIDYLLAQISSIKVKRRIKGEFNWITLFEIPISKISDIDFVKYDFIASNNVTYEYAIVPIMGNTEGEYSINSIKSNFYGVFITDNVTSYKFLASTQYSNTEHIHQSSTFEPYGSKYPIIIHNGNLSYDKGTVSGDVIVLDSSNELDRNAIVEKIKTIKDFLGQPNGKILKDFNGNIWLVTISDNTGINYYNEIGMGFANISFNWSETGDAKDGNDLYYNNLVDAIN